MHARTTGPFIVGPDELVPGAPNRPLSGRTFAVKDMIDVAGQRTGVGNPDLLAAAEPAPMHATAVQRLLDAGATCVGKTHTAESAYSLSGVNEHYGTPINPADPTRDPGGSSSGSAVAVASGLVDVALGTDTAGSVRVPASYCGVIGMRPTHGRVPIEGVAPLAPRFDTVGWLARDGQVARRVGEALLGTGRRRGRITQLLVAEDMFEMCDPGVADALADAIGRVSMALLRTPEPTRFWGMGEAEQWADTFRTLQRADAWRTNRHWIERMHPRFGPTTAQRWEEAASVGAEQEAEAERVAALLTERVWELLSGGAVMIVPTTPGVAPPLDLDPAAASEVRGRLMTFSVISPLARAPQISLPLAQVDGLPVGLGVMAGPGADELLLDLAAFLV
ncbi:amidase [Actinomarinicola tropica]|uniref:Amidase n=1 Tax=Actinomarinicola tropica TaxID=2789776 RepID=A0A5Q2RPN9_9ACTN|nr:amidase [Actinomarinicola tropica]QGG96087.1 amidase [Actinomarinicola tropica]